jgi:trehalose 6-phosphate synthase/phosphatase
LFAKTIFDIKRKENDFIWIQDYHLLFVGKYLRDMENNGKNQKQMEMGFFLHTPFELNQNFVKNFNYFTGEIIIGLLSFNKVGFQTHKDRSIFIELAEVQLLFF